jgi:tol-pal system protein YbgF
VAGAGVSELFAQVQALQEEIRELRGQLEEQGNQLQQLQQQQKDNYLDLDGRLSALITGGIAGVGAAPQAVPPLTPGGAAQAPANPVVPFTTPSSASPPAAPVTPASGGSTVASGGPGERVAYEAAYEQLKQGKMDDALADFQAFVGAYPGSSYAPNAFYWMGEIGLVKNDTEGALIQFKRVVDSYPAHAKAADAHYKLGTLYMQLNDKTKARAHLEKAVLAGGSVAALAQRYLDTHF